MSHLRLEITPQLAELFSDRPGNKYNMVAFEFQNKKGEFLRYFTPDGEKIKDKLMDYFSNLRKPEINVAPPQDTYDDFNFEEPDEMPFQYMDSLEF